MAPPRRRARPARPAEDPRLVAIRHALGQRIQAARQDRGWTQTVLAEQSGVHYVNVARIERGAHWPSWATFYQLSQALGVNMGALLTKALKTVAEKAPTRSA
jgi:transcriptional regulator with XRE-family HTH domain